jgi:poly-beta-1,6-N-acetyl-D-glucosamine N-deacetylase
VFLLLRRSGVPWLVRRTVQRRRVTILVYHDPSPAVLERHLALLCRLYNVISLREYVDGHTLPSHALVLTLDDGHAGNFALRDIFRRFSIVPTIFVCTGVVGTQRGFWFHHAENVERLKRLPDEERVAALAASGFDPNAELDVREALSDQELRALSDCADIQSHTVTHPILPRCTAELAEAEIVDSRRHLQERFNADVYALAYPNGDYTEREALLVQQGGYRCALASDGRLNKRAGHAYALGRIAVDDKDGLDELVVKASGVWGVVERLVRRTS